jgi:hypothetical protein
VGTWAISSPGNDVPGLFMSVEEGRIFDVYQDGK